MSQGKHLHAVRLEDRARIQTQLKMGLNPAAIAIKLNCSAAMLSRELRRNGWTRPTTRRGPGRPPVTGSNSVKAALTCA
jgi:IS30 family transposase